MPRTKRGGASAMLNLMGRENMLRGQGNVLEYGGEEIKRANKQIKLDKKKEEILQRELSKVREDREKQEQKRKRGQMKLLQVLAANKMLGMMHELVLLSDIKEILDDESQEHTLIFPTNDNLEDSTLDIDKLKANKDALNEFLKDYVLRGSLHTEDLQAETPMSVTNLNGKQLDIVKQKGKVLVKHQGKPVAVIVHKDLKHKDDNTLPAVGNIHSITDISPSLDDRMEEARGKAGEVIKDAQETVTDVADTARKTVSTATGTARRAMNNMIDRVSGLFGDDEEKEVSSTPKSVVGGGRKRKRKRKTKRRTKTKRRKAKKSKRRSRK